ncbi:hypothetical protein LOC54_09800 [Acetobacter sp. AN02]|uniref:hypothetical protein n=1 Tax=Acetobacter sp. AN02 TaxID=2894186 RepID=UPI002434455A|nr:hypothetical protein [Acetobacter sp. AN02]MDG6095392.1 hypothetical protein [Acetobacter sp. AN02]
MKLWSVWLPPADEAVPAVIPQKIHWPTFFLGWIGLRIGGMRISAWIIGAISVLFTVAFRDSPLLLPWFVLIHAVLALFVPKFRETELRLRGWTRGPDVLAETKDSALLRFFDHSTAPAESVV